MTLEVKRDELPFIISVLCRHAKKRVFLVHNTNPILFKVLYQLSVLFNRPSVDQTVKLSLDYVYAFELNMAILDELENEFIPYEYNMLSKWNNMLQEALETWRD